MIFSISKEDIVLQLLKQLSNLFIITEEETDLVKEYAEVSFKKCEYNFSQSENKYFTFYENGERYTRFNPYHSVQYMIFLYYLSHALYVDGKSTLLCDKIYYLNKVLNGMDLFYAIELPDFFGAEHPVGSVMGRASYSDGFFFYQCCFVGGTKDKITGKDVYPTLGKNVRMYANSAILGNCKVGNNVNIGAGAVVKDEDIPDDVNVFGESPNLIIKKRKR